MSHLLAPGQEIRFLLKLNKCYGKNLFIFCFISFYNTFHQKTLKEKF